MKMSNKRLAQILFVAMIAGATLFSVKPAVETVFSIQNAKPKKALPIYSVETDKGVALSFDASSVGADDTEEILAILRQNNVKATFFLSGYHVDQYPNTVKSIFEEGHDIANHGNTHSYGTELNLEENQKEILILHEKIYQLLGVEMNLFRAPFGAYNDTVLESASSLGYYTVQWDVDSLDWKGIGVQQEIDQVLTHKSLKNGSILLFHTDAQFTKQTLQPIIEGLKEKGYELIPISELIYKENYLIDHEGRQRIYTEKSNF